MNRSLIRPLVLLLLALPLVAAAAGAAQDSGATPAPDYTNRYEIRFLDTHAAELLAWNQCPARERCRVSSMTTSDDQGKNTRRYLEVRADAATHERIVRALAKEDAAPRTRTFQVSLLLADNKPEGEATRLPDSAQKALQDIRGFLPFKSYHVLDTAWLRTTDIAEGRLVGLRSQGYLVRLRARSVGDVEGKNLYVDAFQVREDPSSGPLVNADGKNRAPRTLIDTSFGMNVGETVVVGTSKLDDGEQALVILVTAVS
jgi:hypothetical protein